MPETLLYTPLHDRHVELGARMVPFAGWEMPVQYEGVIPEHVAVREDCGAFDVSHMGEIDIEGPQAQALLDSLLSNDIAKIAPGQAEDTLLTNERGGIMDDEAGDLWERVLARGAKPCGLGARDTLRLEVCYPLHGNDITPDTDAISAGLGWVCALDRDFTGAEELRRIKEQGPEQKLVAFVMTEKAIPRQGMPIEGGGTVTSGSHSPMLDVGIGMGYVPAATAQPETEITIDVRGHPRRARIVKKPIYNKETK